MKTFDEALEYLVSKAHTQQAIIEKHISQSMGLVLAEDIVSPINVPAFDNSMMDGYALNVSNYSVDTGFQISQRIPAGTSPQVLKEGTVARIFTGAPIPNGANCVIMQEEAHEDEGGVNFTTESVSVGQNIRVLGNDIAQGQIALKKGHRLNAEDLGLISSLGRAMIQVFEPLKIATFTTGDELLEPGMPWQAGKIYNANRYFLQGLIAQNGYELIDLGQVEDTLNATIEAIQKASQVADVVITTGGVSVGEEDHIKPAIDALGHLDMWKVKMKPGKPLAYGMIEQTPFIGLPGNPVSAFATFQLFARPFLMALQGAENSAILPVWVEANFDWTKAGFRREFARAKLVNESQTTKAELFPNQSSGVLNSVSWADGFVVIPEDTVIQKGDKVAFYAFNNYK